MTELLVWDIDEDDEQADWLRTMAWDLPTSKSVFLASIGGISELDHFMTLPAAKAMPEGLLRELSESALTEGGQHNQKTHGRRGSSTARTFATNAEADQWAQGVWGTGERPEPTTTGSGVTRTTFRDPVGTSGTLAELHPLEVNALQDYTTSGYAVVNTHLRGGEQAEGVELTPDQVTQRYVAPLDSATYRQPLPETIVVERTQEDLPIRGATWDDPEAMIGESWSDPAYLSTAIGPTPRENWPVKLTMTVPKGTPAIYVEPISRIKGEYELILGRGRTMRVDSVRRTGKKAEFFDQEILEIGVTVMEE